MTAETSSNNKKRPTILIVGCGVMGLTTAIRLQEQGYEVHIVAKDLPTQTTSIKAAAIWLPFKVAPQDKVNHWSRISYDAFYELAQTAKSGVSMIDFTVLATDESTPSWEAAMPKEAIRLAGKDDLPSGYQFGHVATVPLIESPVYLEYLHNRFTSKGGSIQLATITNLTTLQQASQTLINCTGLGAKSLLNDPLLYPIQGHIAMAKSKAGIKCIADDDGPNALAYVVPRKDGIVLGGTAVAHEDSLEVDSKVIEQIQKRCAQIEPNIKGLPLQSTTVGLRPARSEIRLERDATTGIIHNYGHGGGGYTVSWGCAESVLEMIQETDKL